MKHVLSLPNFSSTRFSHFFQFVAFCASILVLVSTAQAARLNLTISLDAATAGGGGRTGSGSGYAVLDLDNNTLQYYLTFSGMSGTETAAHIHHSGGIAYGLSTGSPKSGTITLTDPGDYTVADQIDDLLHGLWYVNVHSSNFGGGEIRGYFVPDTIALEMTIDGDQAGGAARTGSGSGTATLDIVNDQLSYDISFSGMSGSETASHFHGPAEPGSGGGALYGLGTGSPKTGTLNLVAKSSGTYTVAQQIIDIINGLWYVNIHSTNFGGGELRGQMTKVYVPTIWSSVKSDFTNDGIAGWIWRGTGNGLEGVQRTWSPDWGASTNNWIIPARTFPPDWDASLEYDIETTGDFNGDGDADWLWRAQAVSDARWKIWQMESGNRIGQNNPPQFDADHDWVVNGAGDTDLDGDDDIILNNPSTGEIMIWEMQDYAVAATHSVGTRSGFEVIRVGDFNSDGDADIVLQEQGGMLLMVWEIQDNAFVSEATMSQTGTGFDTVCAGDFDGDGDDDIYLLAATGQSKFFEYENHVRQSQTFGANQSAFTFLGCGDFDGDGIMDTQWTSADGLGYNRILLIDNFSTKKTYYTNRYGGTDPGNNGYGFEYRAQGN